MKLEEATYDVLATVTDAAGNASSDATADELVVDITDPIIPTAASQFTNNTTPLISGTATVAAGETLTVEVDGVIYTAGDGNLVDNDDGTWDLTIPAANELNEGTYDVAVIVTDAAGNTSIDVTAGDLLVDTTPPVVPTTDSQNISNATPVISGTANVAPGETLTVEVDGVTYTAGDGNLVDNGDGTWDLTIPPGSELADGDYDVVATVTDAAGNITGDATASELVVDTTDPAAPAVTALNTNDTTPVLSGTATVAPGETLTVEVNGVVYTAGDGNLVDNGDGTWDLTIPAENELAEGNYDVITTVTDEAGNSTSDTASDALVVDITPPVAPGVTSLTTNNGTPVIVGTATIATGETFSVEVNDVIYNRGDGNLIVNPDGTWVLSVPASDLLVDGTYEVNATVTDAAGNASTDAGSDDLHIDTNAPNSPGVTSQTTNNTTPVISGVAELAPGETLSVEVDGVLYIEGDGNLVVNPDGTWMLAIPTPLADGQYDVMATITDAAGNSSSAPSSSELLIDATAPALASAQPLITTETTPTLTGVANLEPGETLIVEVAGVLYSDGDGNLVVNPDGTWELIIPDNDALAAGNYPVSLTVTDEAGNSSTATASSELVIQPAGDFDGDGIPDVIDLDDDNDGIPDSVEGDLDSDGDGLPDSMDLDSDNDGIMDIVEAGGDDSDNDGQIDNFLDNDGNGLSDDMQLAPFDLLDTDRDGIPDLRDLDSDNDGITDAIESGGIDDDNDGRIDGFSDANSDGADDVVQMSGAEPRDSDNDGVPNHLDLDSDNDGASDTVEAGAVDSDADGIADTMRDSDGDGIPDSVDVSQTSGNDADGDGIDDRFDASFILQDDNDGDGIIDSADPDANGDGLADNPQNAPALGQALPDANNNGIADAFEASDGILITGLDGRGCSIGGPAGRSGPIDPLFALMISAIAALAWRRRSKSLTASRQGLKNDGYSAEVTPSSLARSPIKSACTRYTTASFVLITMALTAVSSLTPTAAHADRNGFRTWLGGAVGLSRLQPDATRINETVTDDNGTALSGMIGMDINHRFGAQIGYTDLGQARLSNNNHVSYYEISADLLVYGLAKKGRREHRLGFLPFGRVGISQMNNNSSLPFRRDNDLSLNVGAGLEYAHRSGLAARAEFTSFDTDALHAGIGLLFRFGGHNRHRAPAIGAAEPVVTPKPLTEEPQIAAAVPTFEPVFFDTDSAFLNDTARETVARIATALRNGEDLMVVD